MTQGAIFYGPRYRPLSSNGGILPGSTVTFYLSETLAQMPVFADGDLTTSLGSVVTADSTGKYPCIYLDPTVVYRVILQDKNGVTIEDTDPYIIPNGSGGSGGGGSGNGPPGVNAVSLFVTVPAIVLPADSAGNVLDFGPGAGNLTVYSGQTDVTSSSQLSIATATNVVGVINTADNTPVNGQIMGYYAVTDMSALTGSLVLQAIYNNVAYSITITVTEAVAGTPGTGAGSTALSLYLTVPFYNILAFADGSVPSFAGVSGYAKVLNGQTDITSSVTFAATPDAHTTGTINTSTNTPVNGQIRGYYQVTALTTSSGAMTITADVSGTILTATFVLTKINIGYEIVGSLPTTNLFKGRIVFLTTDNKLYKYDGINWVPLVNASDMTGLLTAQQIASITAAQLTGTLTTTQIGPNTIQTANLAAAAVQTANLAAGSVVAATIAAGAITAPKLAAGAVTANAIAANSIAANAIQAGAITAAKIAANAITSAQLSTGLLITNSAQIGTGVIGSANIGDLSVSTLKLANNSVTLPVGSFLAQTIELGSPGGLTLPTITIAPISAPQMTSIQFYARFVATGQSGNHVFELDLQKTGGNLGATLLTRIMLTDLNPKDEQFYSFLYVDPDITTGLRTYKIIASCSYSMAATWHLANVSTLVTTLLR